MEYLPTLFALAGMHLLMAMLPGPNIVVVSWLSATASRGSGLLAAAGIVAASLLWVILSMLGVGTLLLEAGWLYRLLRLAGAAYLVYVGIRMLHGALRRGAGMPVAPPGFAALAGRHPFLAGFTTTLSNPKSAVFWTSAFLVMVPPQAPAWLYAVIVGVIGLQATLWYGAVALFFSTGLARRIYERLSRRLDLLAGGIMVLLGLKLADEVRRELTAQALS